MGQEKFTGAGRCLAAATMTVTCALEEARKRGMMSQRDTQSMNRAEFNSYVALARTEWGVTEWEAVEMDRRRERS